MNKQTIKLCCQACINTYGGSYGKVKKIFESGEEYKIGHVEFHTGVLNGILFIVFMGSHGKKDWQDNFKFWQKDVKKEKPYGNIESDIEVHAGFIGQYKSVRSAIHKIVKNHKAETKIICTGHSLGGALATLCAVDLQYNFDKFIECCTFGSPRVGNKAFAESFNRRIPVSLRYVNGSDVVCGVPIWGYEHVSAKRQIGRKNIFRIFKDHYPNNYMIKI